MFTCQQSLHCSLDILRIKWLCARISVCIYIFAAAQYRKEDDETNLVLAVGFTFPGVGCDARNVLCGAIATTDATSKRDYFVIGLTFVYILSTIVI